MQSSPILDGSEPALNAAQRPNLKRDRTSSFPAPVSLASPPSVDPEPAYIAPSAASQIVTSDHQNQTEDWFEEKEDDFDQDGAVVSPSSLALVNAFLDQLLFNILACARSTSIASLRPAVSEVLKPRLAKDAINGADEELQEFLGGGDEEELSAFHNGHEPRGAWDLNLVWRRTRLRCMVYTRLGDMEEEDEDAYVAREHLEQPNDGHRRLSRDLGIVSPAAAIFLTSILEFVGEQALLVAGEAAYTRAETRRARTPVDETGSEIQPRVVVEDTDMEKIAFNTTLGRLWRSWKKRVRPASVLNARTISRDYARGKSSPNPNSNPTSRPASISEVRETVPRPSNTKVHGEAPTSRSPLPDNTNPDVAGNTAIYSEAQNVRHEPQRVMAPGGRRPSSMVIYPPRDEQIPLEPPVNFMLRRRSSSLPAHHPAVYASPLSNIATTPEEVSESSSSVHDEEVSLPAAPTSSVPSMSAIEATMYDNVVHTVEENRDSGSTGGSGQETPGMSKQEFDRQMLKLVEELKPQSTPDLDEGHSPPHNIHESLSKAIPEGIAGDVEAPGSSDENETLAKTQASRGVDPSTIDYWRGSREPETAPYGGREGESTQGVRSRAASEDTIDNDYGRILEHRVPYSYHGPSVPHSNDEPDTASSYGKRFTNGNPIPISTAEAVRTQEADNGAPPLTPLRELMEAAHDTSDEASSLAPSQDASRSDYAPSERFHNSDLPKTGPFSSRNTSLAKPVAKLSDLRSQLPAVTTGIERAAVQRVMPSPVSAREPFTPVGRTSTSSNHDLRPIHTSGSGTSQVSQKLKGLVGRDSSDSRRPGTPRRSLEGSGSMASDIRYSRTPKAEDAQRNFDQLIKSDETIQYTLTPQSMREMEVPDSPRWNQKRTDTAETADSVRETVPQDSETARTLSSRSNVPLKGLNGLRSNTTNNAEPPELASPAQPISQAKVPSRPSASHSQAGVARDARAKDESVREFADFLRSTGPAIGAIPPQKPGPPIAEPRPIKALPAASTRPSSQQGPPKKIMKPNPSTPYEATVTYQVESATSKRSRPKLLAREATLSSDSTSELADFIREGPSDRSEGRMRIPRTGEPSRPISDTNGIHHIADGKPKEADNSRISVASTQLSSAPSKSVHSVNSRTGLLDSTIANTDTTQRTSGSREERPPRQDDPPHPVRKQRRAKDPYAIDTESDDDGAHQPPPQKQEESLIDFLNSATPPPTPPASQSVFTNSSKISKQPLNTQKNRYPSMRERLTRNGVSVSNAKKRPSPPSQPSFGVPSITRGKSETRQQSSSMAPGKVPIPQTAPLNRARSEAPRSESINHIKSQAPQIPPFNPRETSPHLITQVGTKLDTYRITSPTYAAHVDRDRKVPRRSPVQQYQPRGEREPGSDISDLAEFFKNSGPPTAVPTRRPNSPVKEKEKEGGFGRMFTRRKKSGP